jgi:6-phosphogluconolactonase
MEMREIIAALFGAGCLISSANAATFVYVGNAESQNVSVLELKSNGELTPVETAAVPGPQSPAARCRSR